MHSGGRVDVVLGVVAIATIVVKVGEYEGSGGWCCWVESVVQVREEKKKGKIGTKRMG